MGHEQGLLPARHAMRSKWKGWVLLLLLTNDRGTYRTVGEGFGSDLYAMLTCVKGQVLT